MEYNALLIEIGQDYDVHVKYSKIIKKLNIQQGLTNYDILSEYLFLISNICVPCSIFKFFLPISFTPALPLAFSLEKAKPAISGFIKRRGGDSNPR